MITKVFWGLVSLLLVVIGILYFAVQNRSEAVGAINAFVQAANSGLPRQVDEFTVLNSVYSKDMSIYFEYAMQEDESYSEMEHKKSVLELFRNVVCVTPKFNESLLEKNVKFKFLYVVENSNSRVFEFDRNNCE